MKEFVKRSLGFLCAAAACMILAISVSAADGDVAKIGETGYVDIDEAIAEAANGDTITLLTDVTVTKAFDKDLTFNGNGTLNMDTYGWYYRHTLTFDGDGVGLNCKTTENAWRANEEQKWLILCLNGTLKFTNGAKCVFDFDSNNGTVCAIYMSENGSAEIIVENGSSFAIYGHNTIGKSGQGIQLGSTANTGIWVTENSTFLIDGTNRGYVNSPITYVEDSAFTVQNCTSNGSNGGVFTAINSRVEFLNNRGHGLSVSNASFTDSVFHGIGNGYTGLHVAGKFEAVTTEGGTGATELTLAGNSWNAFSKDTFAALRLTGNASFGKDVTVAISDNYGVGLRCNSADAQYIFDQDANLTIVKNGKVCADGVQYNTIGGGIWNKGILVVPADAVIYNNHAETSGDDIYNREGASVSFGPVGEDWYLDGTPDCNGKIHAIDGWYEDGAEGIRWLADTENEADRHVELREAGTISGVNALKAAHAYREPEYVWDSGTSCGSDTATGYGRKNNNSKAYKAGGNWFLAQRISIADGESQMMDIQAGNPKNGTNFIGTVTLTRKGNEYTVHYALNDDVMSELPDPYAYQPGDTVTLTEISNCRYLASAAKIAVSNNGKDLKTCEDGLTFTMEQDTFYFYIHFNVVYTQYTIVDSKE